MLHRATRNSEVAEVQQLLAIAFPAMDKVVAVIETVKLPSDSQRPAVVGDKFESVDRYVGGEWPLVLPAAEQHDRLVPLAR